MKYVATVNGQPYEVDIQPDGRVLVNGREHRVDFQALGQRTFYSLLIDSASYEGLIQEAEGSYQVLVRGILYTVQVTDEREQRLAKAHAVFAPDSGEIVLRAPMPGLIIDVLVSPGQEVSAGQTLVILESMKMQNELKTPRAGRVHAVSVRAGDSVEQSKTLVTIA
jgi:biotin carboxyl carrier protein